MEKVRPTEKKIAPCLGCYYCASHGGECVRRDDMADLLQQMIDADVIVLASPVYFYSINAQLKAVIDRTQCVGCTVCAQVCPFGAIVKEEV